MSMNISQKPHASVGFLSKTKMLQQPGFSGNIYSKAAGKAAGELIRMGNSPFSNDVTRGFILQQALNLRNAGKAVAHLNVNDTQIQRIMRKTIDKNSELNNEIRNCYLLG